MPFLMRRVSELLMNHTSSKAHIAITSMQCFITFLLLSLSRRYASPHK
jgi:hypothetical protein